MRIESAARSENDAARGLLAPHPKRDNTLPPERSPPQPEVRYDPCTSRGCTTCCFFRAMTMRIRSTGCLFASSCVEFWRFSFSRMGYGVAPIQGSKPPPIGSKPWAVSMAVQWGQARREFSAPSAERVAADIRFLIALAYWVPFRKRRHIVLGSGGRRLGG